jgi:hypothetical protein
VKTKSVYILHSSHLPHKNRTATPIAASKPNPDLAVSTAAPPAFAEVVGLPVVNGTEMVLEDVTVDSVVEAVVMGLVTELVILPLELDMEPVEVDKAVALVAVPETEAVGEGADEEPDEEAIVVESIANCPE